VLVAGKRPCSECKRWFTTDPRIGSRQHVCPRPECRAARNRRACADWRRENPDKVIAGRLRRKLPKTPPDPVEVVLLDPMRHFSPAVVRHAMGQKETVVLEEVAKVLVHIARHGMPPKVAVRTARTTKVPQASARHEWTGDGPGACAPIGPGDAHP
jgi:hypothetical protein